MSESDFNKFRRDSDEVLYARSLITTITPADIKCLVQLAKCSERKRIRICAHLDPTDLLHDMIIVILNDTYVRPHKHLNKAEAFHVIEGSLQVVIFEENGTVRNVVKLGSYSSGETFFYRMSERAYHTVIPTSEFVVFHETTSGPFQKEETIYPVWAPDDRDEPGRNRFLEQLRGQLNEGINT